MTTYLLMVLLTLVCACALAWFFYRIGFIAIPDETHRLGCLDGLRGYLALAVMFHHFFIWRAVIHGANWGLPPVNIVANFGHASVAVFFMITGALFYPKITRGIGGTNWISLYIARVLRLSPMMWAITIVVVLIIVIEYWKSGVPISLGFHVTIRPILRWLTFGTPDIMRHPNTSLIVAGVIWSLAYEWDFYLFLPVAAIIMATLPRKWNRIYFLAALLFVLAVAMYAGMSKHLTIVDYLPLFVIGMLGRELVAIDTVTAWLRSNLAAYIGLAAATLEFIVFRDSIGVPQYVLLGIFFLPCLAGNDYFGIFRQKFSVVLGELSYSIYLLHGSILYLFMAGHIMTAPIISYGIETYLLLPLLGLIIVAMTAFSYSYVELPGINLGKRINRWITENGLRMPFRTHTN